MDNDSKGEGQGLPRKNLSQFHKDLENRYNYHKKMAEKHVKTFKPIGFTFGLFIPVLAALVTFSMTTESGILARVSVLMGLALTLLTIVNSVLKPDERFARAVQYCIELHDWKRDLDIRVAEINTKDRNVFLKMIQDMDNKLSQIGQKMAEGWVPKPQT